MIRSVFAVGLLGAGMALTTSIVFAQTTAQASSAAPSRVAAAPDSTLGIIFDVVSIKPSRPDSRPFGVTTPPESDTLSGGSVTLEDLVRWAYHLGGRWGEPEHPNAPKWYSTDHFDIRAKVAASDVDAWRKLNEEARRIVVRKVLADRFQLACHFEDVEGPVYFLAIAPGGSKMTEAKPGEISPWHFHFPGDPNTAYSGSGMTMRETPDGWITVYQRMDMAEFVKSSTFAYTVDRPVIDKTGLPGVYNFSLNFAYQQLSAVPGTDGVATEPSSSPDIFNALQHQLGLKLERGRGPMNQLVIDHVERLSDD